VARLRDFPELGATFEDWNDPAFREITFQDQRIVYSFDGTIIEILTVFHGSHVPNLSDSFDE
jgi:plasmid stabilization system protein ParE